MGYPERKLLYLKHEELRGNPLITYVTSIRPNLSAQMAGDVIPIIINQINNIPEEKENIDFLIISNGGDPITSLRIISILRQRFKKINVIIPYVAYSAATILALGADEIVMHPYSNLGPVDPQLTVSKQNGNGQPSNVQFSSEDIRNYIEFVKSDVGITDQAHLIAAFNSLASDVGPLPIGNAKRSQQLSLTLSIKMLESHIEDKTKAATIAQALNSSYYHHGYAVNRSEALNMGLKVVLPDSELEKLIWSIWDDFCAEMKCTKDFSPINEIMSDPTSKAKMDTIPVIPIPINTPPEFIQNIMVNMAQQYAQVQQQSPLETSQLLASVETNNKADACRVTLSIAYWRDANMAISYNVTSFSEGWKSY